MLAPNARLRAAVVPGPGRGTSLPSDGQAHGAPAGGLTLLLVEQKLDIAPPFAQLAYVLIKGHVELHETTVQLARRAD